MPHIFERFYQVDDSSTGTAPADRPNHRPQEGTGIGLAIVNELVDLQGGTSGQFTQLLPHSSRFKWAEGLAQAEELTPDLVISDVLTARKCNLLS